MPPPFCVKVSAPSAVFTTISPVVVRTTSVSVIVSAPADSVTATPPRPACKLMACIVTAEVPSPVSVSTKLLKAAMSPFTLSVSVTPSAAPRSKVTSDCLLVRPEVAVIVTTSAPAPVCTESSALAVIMPLNVTFSTPAPLIRLKPAPAVAVLSSR